MLTDDVPLKSVHGCYKLGFGQAFMRGIIIIIVGTSCYVNITRPLGGGMIDSVLTGSKVEFDGRIHPSLIKSCFDSTCVHWKDTDGNRIEAHAAGMLQSHEDGRWYWFGESKKNQPQNIAGVNLYSAPDLGGPWKFEGQVLKQTDIVVPGRSGPWIVERPKVLYNNVTKKYVMWFHLDSPGYKFRHSGVAQADHPAGPYEWVHALQPDGIPSLDMSLFQDPVDGSAYLIRSCDNKYAGFSRLSADYLNTTGLIYQHPKYEGMAAFRHPNGTYYIITSHLTGWNPNPLMLFRAEGKNLSDPQWVNMGNPTHDSRSFNTQPTYVVSAIDKHGESYFIYMSDNWVHGGPQGLTDAAYVWLPLKFGANEVTLSKTWAWSMADPFAPPPPPPPPTPAPPCVAKSGVGVHLYPCSRGGDGQRWNKTVGSGNSFTLSTGSDLCLSSSGGSVDVQPCDATDHKQLWTSDTKAQRSRWPMTSDTKLQRIWAWLSSYKREKYPYKREKYPYKREKYPYKRERYPYKRERYPYKTERYPIAQGRYRRRTSDTKSQRIKRASDGHCLDQMWCSLSACPSAAIDVWKCNNDHQNQEFLFMNGSIVLAANTTKCLSACHHDGIFV